MGSRTFTVAATVDDPLTAERLVEILREGGHDAFARAGGAASVAAFASATPAIWDILVPTEVLEQVSRTIREELESIEKNAEENAKAAEEESMSGETAVPEK